MFGRRIVRVYPTQRGGYGVSQIHMPETSAKSMIQLPYLHLVASPDRPCTVEKTSYLSNSN